MPKTILENTKGLHARVKPSKAHEAHGLASARVEFAAAPMAGSKGIKLSRASSEHGCILTFGGLFQTMA